MKIPSTKHYAIITTTSIYVPGDERSRTNLGHGYPEHTVEFIDYKVYNEFGAFERAVKEATARKLSFTAIEANPFKIETKVILSK